MSWFAPKSGLNFACTACGRCCRGAGGHVFVNSAEVTALARQLNVERARFEREFMLAARPGQPRSLKARADGRACIFLDDDDKTCQVYRSRPTQCRTYPFWPLNVLSEYDWQAESQRCEGIRAEPVPASEHEQSEADLVDSREVLLNMVVHEIHSGYLRAESTCVSQENEGRASSESATYDSTRELLEDAISQQSICDVRSGQGLLEEFENDFFGQHRRAIRFDDGDVIVIDSVLGEGAPTRRTLRFAQSAALVQSEVVMHADGSFDRSSLAFPVHRELACCAALGLYAVCKASSPASNVTPTRARTSTTDTVPKCTAALPSPSTPVLLIGTGAGTLPLALRDALPHSIAAMLSTPAVIETLDISESVSNVAAEYFGMPLATSVSDSASEFGDERGVWARIGDGITYVETLASDCPQRKFGAVLVDVDGTDNVGTALRAPDAAFATQKFIAAARHVIIPGGLFAMNVIARGPPLVELCNLLFDLFDAAYMVAVPGGEGDQYVLIGLVDSDDCSSTCTAMTAVSSLAAVAELYPNLKPLIEDAALQKKCKWHPLSTPPK